MDLFTDVVSLDKQHPIYKIIKKDEYWAERDVLNEWAQGLKGRDGKFVKGFWTTFEPCLRKLYIHTYMKEIGHICDLSFDAPDFVIVREHELCIEATIALPAIGQPPAHSFDNETKLGGFNEFSSQAAVRITNSFIGKINKLREHHSKLEQCRSKPFVIAIASFDRPFSRFSASRPILAAMYGLYHGEEVTMAPNAEQVISYNADTVLKNGRTEVDMGLFCTPDFSDANAVIYSSLVTWGKLRVLADNPSAPTVSQIFTLNPDSTYPNVHTAQKCDYKEHLSSSLYALRNPSAKNSLPPEAFGHPRIIQCYTREDGYLDFETSEGFLLLRYLTSLKYTK